jgi:hypothetical protein
MTSSNSERKPARARQPDTKIREVHHNPGDASQYVIVWPSRAARITADEFRAVVTGNRGLPAKALDAVGVRGRHSVYVVTEGKQRSVIVATERELMDAFRREAEVVPRGRGRWDAFRDPTRPQPPLTPEDILVLISSNPDYTRARLQELRSRCNL